MIITCDSTLCWPSPLRWRHNERDDVSTHQPYDCLLNRLFRHDQRKHQSFASLVFVKGIHRWPVNSPHIGIVTRKMFPFHDIIMQCMHVAWAILYSYYHIAFYYKSLAISVMGMSVASIIISTMIRLCLVWPLEMCECNVVVNSLFRK